MSQSLSGPPPRTPLPLTRIGLGVGAAVLVAAVPAAYFVGFSVGTAEADQDSVTTTPLPGREDADGSSAPALGRPDPLAIVLDSEESDLCFTRMPGRLHLLDVQWKAAEDLESVSFRLEGEHVTTAPAGIATIPPVNPGGTIAVGGSYDADVKGGVLDSRLVDADNRQPLDFLYAGAGDTGMLDWPLRFDLGADRTAWIDLVAADYTTATGETGTVEMPVDWSFRFPDRPGGC